MLPALRTGDVVVIDPVMPDELRRGRVVAARVHGRLLIHRIRKVDRNGSEITVFLRGDNRLEADPPVSAAEVVGKIDRLERDGRQLCLPIRPLILTSTLRRWVRRSRQQLAMRRWFRTR
jgi:signal peptidase I